MRSALIIMVRWEFETRFFTKTLVESLYLLVQHEAIRLSRFELGTLTCGDWLIGYAIVENYHIISKISPKFQNLQNYYLRMAGMVNWKDLNLLKSIGSGGHGNVYHCKHSQWGYLAVKCFKADQLNPRQMKALTLEIDIMKQIRHPNCVQFFGTIIEASDDQNHGPGIVMEYVKHGSLSDFLHKYNRDITWDVKTMFAYDVALGMNYLHTHGEKAIFHFDLKARNVLVDEYLHLKIADFGLAEWTTIVQQKSQSERTKKKAQDGTLTHMAPEWIQDPQCDKTECIDVYSYGITLWEIITGGEEPFKDLDTTEVWNGVKDTKRPKLDVKLKREAPSLLQELMTESWHQVGKERPTFQTIKTRLDIKIQGEEFKEKVEKDKIKLKIIIMEKAKGAGNTDITANMPKDDTELDPLGDTEPNGAGTGGAVSELERGVKNLFLGGKEQSNAPVQRHQTTNREFPQGPVYGGGKTKVGQAQQEQEQRQAPQETQQVARTADVTITRKGEKGSTVFNLRDVKALQIGDNNVMNVNKNT